MLVLTRKPGESVVIGDNIVVTIVEVDRGKVRVGIDAPPHVKIRREELLEGNSDLRSGTNVHAKLPLKG